MRYFMLWFVKITGIIPFLLLYRPVRYYENDKSRERSDASEILIANHTTMMDFAMMLFIYPLRTIRVLMAEVLFKTPLSAWFMKQLHGIKVNRDIPENTDRLSEAIDTLVNGGIVGVFPEGRLNKGGKNYGPFYPFHSGAAYLALKTGAKIRPVYFNVRCGFHCSGMMIGEPVDLRSAFGETTDSANLANATKLLRSKMEQLREMLSFQSGHQKKSLFTRFTHGSALLGMRIGFRRRVHYESEDFTLDDIHRASVIACNHTGVFDPPLLYTVFRKFRPHILAAEALYKQPMLAILLRRLGCIRVDRNVVDMESFHIMTSVLQNNECVGIFPEGKISENGELAPFHPGAVLAAMATGVDIIPVYIAGEAKVFGRKGLDIWIGRPLKVDGNMTPDNIKQGTDRLYDSINRLKILSGEGGKNE